MSGLPVSRNQQIAIGLLIAVITAVSLLPDIAMWRGSWGETGAALEISTILSYPAVGALAAWIGTAGRRQHFEVAILANSRSRVELYSRLIIRLSLIASAGFLIIAGAGLIATATQANFGSIPVLSLLAVCAGFFVTAAFGVLIGTILPTYVAPVVVIAAIYAGGYFIDSGRPSVAPLSALMIADGRDRTLLETLAWVQGARIVFFLAAGWAMLALAARHRTLWLIPFSIACLMATPLLLAGRSTLQPVPGAARPVCTDRADLRVCLTTARSHEVSDVINDAQPLFRKLDGLSPDKFVLIEQTLPGLGETRLTNDELIVRFGIVNGIFNDAHQVDSQELIMQLTGRILQGNCISDNATGTDGRPFADPADVLEASVLTALNIPIDGTASFNAPILTENVYDWSRVADFRTSWNDATPAAKKRWFHQHAADVIGCTYDKNDLDL